MLLLKDYDQYIVYTLEETCKDKLYKEVEENFKNGDLIESIDFINNGLTLPIENKLFKYFTIEVAKSTWANIILKRQIKRHIEICKKLEYEYYKPIYYNKNILFIKNYHYNKLINYKITKLKDTFMKALHSLLHFHKQGYAHGNINPFNIIINDEIYFINYECSVSLSKKETHCKKINLKFASNSLIKKHNLKYPRRSFTDALLDDICALILSFCYVLTDKKDSIFLKDIDKSRYLTKSQVLQYIEDSTIPEVFLPYTTKFLKEVYIETFCYRYKIDYKHIYIKQIYGGTDK